MNNFTLSKMLLGALCSSPTLIPLDEFTRDFSFARAVIKKFFISKRVERCGRHEVGRGKKFHLRETVLVIFRVGGIRGLSHD